MWALDTDTLTLWLHGQASIARRVSEHDPDELAITIITVEEVLSGWYRLIRQARNDDKLVRASPSLPRSPAGSPDWAHQSAHGLGVPYTFGRQGTSRSRASERLPTV